MLSRKVQICKNITITQHKYPLFVTWQKGKEKELRGCIGTFDTNRRLEKLLFKYTLIAAFDDDRFEPIVCDEVEHLHCCISLLVNFEQANDAFDWDIGIHGIEIEFEHRGKDWVNF